VPLFIEVPWISSSYALAYLAYINLPLSVGFVVLSGALENLFCCATKF